MSIKVMTAVWDYSTHKGSELLLLLALADFAHDDGSGIFPSVETMKHKTRLAERSVRYILRTLEASHELVAEGKHHSGTTLYRIDVAQLTGAKIAPAKTAPRQITAKTGANDGKRAGQPTAPDPSVNHPEPSDDVNPLPRLLSAVRRAGPGR